MPSLAGFRSRVRRLERRIKGAECDSCTKTALMRVAARADSTLVAPERCPECGNPNPRIPMRIIDELMERYERKEELERAARERKLERADTNGTGPESEGGSSS